MEFPRYIAHRGLHDKNRNIPENSLSAFEAAAENGFAVELDVRFTADRRMVVFHDADTERMCGEKHILSQTTLAELRKLRLSGTDERIPLLSEVLKLIDGRVMILIELKHTPEVPDAEKRLVHMLKAYKGEFAVESFDPVSLMKLRTIAPEITRGQLVSTFRGEKQYLRQIAAAKTVWRLVSKPQFIAWDLRTISLEAAFYAADIDAHFITWTADNEQLLEAAEDFSGTIIFENVPMRYFDGKER